MRQLCQQLLLLLGLVLLGVAIWEQNAGQQPHHSNSLGAWPLPGACGAVFVDPIMLAAPFNSSLLNNLSLSPVYDTSNNFATHTYNWTTGRWTAPEKQKQWWEGRRPANFTAVDLYLNEAWNGTQPYSVFFYPQPDLTNKDAFNGPDDYVDPTAHERWAQGVQSRGLPSGAPVPWHGNNLAFASQDYAHAWHERGNANIDLVDYGPTQCRTEFVEVCSPDNTTGVHVYTPAHLDYGTTPSWLNTSKTPNSYLTNSSWLGWHWDWEAVDGTGGSQPYVCEVALRELVIPSSIKGITFNWDSGVCARSGRSRPFVTNYDDMGPVVYHDAKHTLEPKAAVLSYQAVDLFLSLGHNYGDTPLEHGTAMYVYTYEPWNADQDPWSDSPAYPTGYSTYLPYWPQQHTNADAGHPTPITDPWLTSNPGSGNNCTTSMSDGDKCTLTISPAPPDVWDQAPACARSIPHGVPLLVCRAANHSIIPFGYNRAHLSDYAVTSNFAFPDTVPKLRYTAAGKYNVTKDASFQPVGLVPNVPCNRFTWSRRFGGRCAAPVVQYLAYDEAYHTSNAQASYVGIPEYGGCLDGGLMRFIKPSIQNNYNTTNWNDPSIRKWFTPPMWPYTAWRAASDVNDTTTDLLSLYGSDWKAEDLNLNQEKLDRLFIHQKIFQVPDIAPVSGCTVIQRSGGRCLSAPSSLTDSINFWNGSLVQMATCNSNDPHQCFQIEGDISSSARIMYKGLCVGVDPSGTLPSHWNQPGFIINLRPCDEGWTGWQRLSNGYVKLGPSQCATPSSNTGQCGYTWNDRGGSWQYLALSTLTDASKQPAVLNMPIWKFNINTAKPAWPTYTLLRQFWLDSFASSAVDIRAHRIRFIPYGARQGLNTRGAGVNQGCNGTLGQWANANDTQMINNCLYNRGVTLGGVTYDQDSCMKSRDDFLASNSSISQPASVCWTNTAWMYLYANECDRYSNDLRLSQRDVSRNNAIAQCGTLNNCSGANPADKCTSRVGGQYVAVDDVWSFMESDSHDPCSWPFVECVAGCSLPSDPTVKSWATNSTDGFVYSGTKKVGCVGLDCTYAMKDPKVANKIAAIDLRNLALYSNNLNFSAFQAIDSSGTTFGSKVWYLNLNYNMLGGDLSQLANLPTIFPNLVHLGLAHCSAGMYAPQYAWQQTQPQECPDTGPPFTTNASCYCPRDSWDNMTVIPNVGAAIADFKANNSLTWTVARGVRRMFYGSIPDSWGANAAWSKTLMSINLAGHSDLIGELPAAWYNQTAFPQLYYVKLLGTQIRPVTTKLIWKNPLCNSSNIAWHIKDMSTTNSAATWVATCGNSSTTNGNCSACDWWPARSAAPWYFTGTTQSPTCANYLPNNSSGSYRFPCWQAGGYQYNLSSDSNTSPGNNTCCSFVPTCGRTDTLGSVYKCMQSGMVVNSSATGASPPNDAICCMPFVPTCQRTTIDGGWFACPTTGTYDNINPTATNPNVTTCCQFVPTCGAMTANGTQATCSAPLEFDPNAFAERNLTDVTASCCKSTNCAANNSTFPPGIYTYTNANNQQCWKDTCGALSQLNDDGSVNTSLPAVSFTCGYPGSLNTTTAALSSTRIGFDACCYIPTCGQRDLAGHSYGCNSNLGQVLIPANLNKLLTSDDTIDNPMCCWVPTCGVYTYTLQLPFQCTGAWKYSGNDNAINPSQATCCTELFPDLALTQSTNPASQINIGSSLVITLTVSNTGAAAQYAASDVSVAVNISTDFVLVSSTPAGCTRSSGTTITCPNTTSLAISGSTIYTITATATVANLYTISSSVAASREQVTNNNAVQGTITVIQSCGHYQSDGSAYTCSAPYVTNVAASSNTSPSVANCCTEQFADLNLTLTTAASAYIGTPFDLTVTLGNQGQYQATTVTLTLPLPNNVAFVSSNPAGCSASGQTVTCPPSGSLASVAVNSNVVYTITVKASVANTYNLTASVAASREQITNNNAAQGTTTVIQTCGHYQSDGSAYTCSAPYITNVAASPNTSPSVANCCIEQFPDMNITLTTVASAYIGTPFDLTVTLGNQGQYQATTVTLTLPLPNNVAFVSSNPAGCSASGQTVTCPPSGSLASVAVNSNVVYTITVKASVANTYNLTASVAASREQITNNNAAQGTTTVIQTCGHYQSDGSAYTCSAPYITNVAASPNTSPSVANCCIEQFPDMNITLTTVASADIGTPFDLTVTLGNQGQYEAASVAITLPLPNNVAYVSSNPADCLASGQTVTCTPPANVAVNSNVVYTITVKASAAGTYNLPASVAASRETNTANNGPVSANVTISQTCQHNDSSTSAAYICPDTYKFNNAAASNTSPSQATCCTEIYPDLAITQASSASTNSDQVYKDDTFDVNVTVSNVGEYGATNVVVTQTLPTGLTFASSNPTGCTASGQTVTCTAASLVATASTSYIITIQAATAGVYNVSSSVASAPREQVISNNGPVQNSVTVISTCAHSSHGNPFSCPDTFAFKSSAANSINPNQATCCMEVFPDLAISQTSSASANSDQVYKDDIFQLSVAVSNVGDYDATNLTVTHTLTMGLAFVLPPPTGCTASGQTMTCTVPSIVAGQSTAYIVQVQVQTATAGVYTVSSSVASAPREQVTSNNSGQKSVTVVSTCGQYTQSNLFPCPAPTFVYNSSSASSSNPDQATCCTELFPDLALTQSASASSGQAALGDVFTMTLVVVNQGDYEATAVTTTQTLPNGLQFVPSSASTGCNIADSQHLSCGPESSISSNVATHQKSYTVQVKAVTDGTFSITAVTTTTRDSDPSNNSPAPTSITVIKTCLHADSTGSQYSCPLTFAFNNTAQGSTTVDQASCCTQLNSDLILQQDSNPTNGQVIIADTFTVTITVLNQGTYQASNVATTQSLSSGLQYVSPAPTDCHINNPQSLSCGPVATIAAGQSAATTSYTVSIKAVAAGASTVNATVATPDPNTSNNGLQTLNIAVGQTCLHFHTGGSPLVCSAGYVYQSSANNAANPSNSVCCQYTPICSAVTAGGQPYTCPSQYTLDPSKATSTSPNAANCCMYVPICGAFWANGTIYQCPVGTQLNTTSSGSTTPNDATCCQDIDPCASNDPCSYVTHAVNGTCVDLPAPDPGTGFSCSCNAGYTWDITTTPASCSYVPKCGATTDGGSAYTCLTHYVNNPAASSQTSISNANCCTFVPFCGGFWANGTAYQCPVGTQPNAANTGSTTPNDATCCQDIDACAGLDPCSSITHAVNGTCVDLPAPDPGTGFSCSCNAGYTWNITTTPASCSYIPKCGATTDGGPAYTCLPHYVNNPAASSQTSISNANCCTFVPSCGFFWANGTAYQCPVGTQLNGTNTGSTTPNDATCCQDINACAGPDPCASLTHAVNGTCVDLPAPDSGTGFSCSCDPGYTWNITTIPASCTYVPKCGATTEGGPAYTCTAHYVNNPAASSQTTLSTANCCTFQPSCGVFWANGTAYQCPVGTQLNATNSGSTTPNDATCCQDIDACAGPDPCSSLTHAVNGTCVDLPAPDPGTGFSCSCNAGYMWNITTTPASCNWTPKCGATTDGGPPYVCPAHYVNNATAASQTTLSTATCCTFVPTCGFYAEDGSQYPCPAGRVLNTGNASSTTTSNATCCRKPPQGQCPTADVRPTMHAPTGSSSGSIPVLVTFPVVDSQAVYCPLGTAPDGKPANMCVMKLTTKPMFSYPGVTINGVVSTAPADGDGSNIQLSYSCIRITDLTCQLQLDLPHDGRWGFDLLPSVAQMDWCDQTITLQLATAEVVVDSKPPLLVNHTLMTPPTLAMPDYQICTVFSEPIMWVDSSSSNMGTTSSSGGATSSSSSTSTAAPAAFSSSSIALTNTILLNITMPSEALALLPDGMASGAANKYCMWLRTWSGATAQVAVLSTAYQDIAGNKGQQNSTLQVTAPGTDLWHQASNLASTASAVAAASSALGAAAAATSASGAGGATSILRSVGHTQFLAMSVSLAVPWLPPEYVKLCTGLAWSNLVQPAEAVVSVTTNATTYLEGQRTPASAPTPTGRRLAEAPQSPSSSSTAPNGQYRQLLQQQDVSISDWLAQHKDIGPYQSSNRSTGTRTSTSSSGVFVFASNGSSSSNISLLAAGNTRQPKYFSLHDLQLSVLTLGVAVVAATLVQWMVAGLWRLLQLNTKNMPTLLIFPKPQVFIYTLLMIPVIYGAGKLLAIADLSTSDGQAGLACVVLLPLPVLAFWIYILHNWRKSFDDLAQGRVARSKSSILRTYSTPSHGASADLERYEQAAHAAAAAAHELHQRPSATLALLGTGEDNPTLIIRERHAGEDELNQILDPVSSDDEAEHPVGFSRQPAASQNPVTPGSGGSQGGGRPWRSLQSVGGGGSRDGSSRSGRGSRAGAAAMGVEDFDASGDPTRQPRYPRPLAEGKEDTTLDEQQQRAMAAAWDAARTAGPSSSAGGWRSHSGAPEHTLSTGGVAVTAAADGTSADGRGVVARQQTWMGNELKGIDAAVEAATTAAGAVSFLDRYWYLVDDLVGDDRAAAVERVKLSVLTFYLVSAVQRCLTALFFGLFHYSYVSVSQLGVLIGVHALFVVYLLAAKPYAFSILLYADVLAYCCELTILGAALYLKQSPANTQLLNVLVVCYFVDVAVMLVPEVLRYAVMAYTWLKHRQLRQQGVPATEASDLTSSDGGVVAAVAVRGAAAGGKQHHHHHQQHGKGHRQQQYQRPDSPTAAAPRTSDARSAANAAAAAGAAITLTHRRKR